MIFSELYSTYYNTVAKILEKALSSDLSNKELEQIVIDNAFNESILTIPNSLHSGKWALLDVNNKTSLNHKPTMPLTTLQKRWLKSILSDEKIKLFDVDFKFLENVEPLFTSEDYCVYDRYGDGDNYKSERYINNFRTILFAIKKHKPISIEMFDRYDRKQRFSFYPKGIEYSLKDDKFRVLARTGKFSEFNVNKIISCRIIEHQKWQEKFTKVGISKQVVLNITDDRNAVERVLTHFAHFDKSVSQLDEKHFQLKLNYYESDETEILIRILSFGALVKVIEPESFIFLIKDRLISQKNCGL